MNGATIKATASNCQLMLEDDVEHRTEGHRRTDQGNGTFDGDTLDSRGVVLDAIRRVVRTLASW